RDDPQRPAPLAGDETGLLSPAPDPVTPAAQHREGALHPVVELPGGLQWEPGGARSDLRALAGVPGVGGRLRLVTRFVVPADEDPAGGLAVHVHAGPREFHVLGVLAPSGDGSGVDLVEVDRDEGASLLRPEHPAL